MCPGLRTKTKAQNGETTESMVHSWLSHIPAFAPVMSTQGPRPSPPPSNLFGTVDEGTEGMPMAWVPSTNDRESVDSCGTIWL